MDSLSNKSSIASHTTQFHHQYNGGHQKNEFCNGKSESHETNGHKSFVQQSIERLYGPGALSIGFSPRRFSSQNKRWDSSEDKNEALSSNTNSAKSFPSVFKHLRPEFRHQLPVRKGANSSPKNSPINTHSQISTSSKTSFHSVKCRQVDGPIVRYIPIVMEDDAVGKKVNRLSISDNSPVIPQKTNTLQSKLISPNLVQKQSPMILKSNGTVCSSSFKPLINNNVKEEHVEESEGVHDGTYFLKIVDVEVSELTKEAERIEKDLEAVEGQITEEVKGKLLAATGKIRLLIAQKIKQFKGLCEKNLKKDPNEEFPTTNDDLAGFWDMVSLQVDEVKGLVKEINKLRENNWKEVKRSEKVIKGTTTLSKSKPTKVVSQAEKAKSEARKKAMEERRKAMREAIAAKKKQANNSDIQIFVS